MHRHGTVNRASKPGEPPMLAALLTTGHLERQSAEMAGRCFPTVQHLCRLIRPRPLVDSRRQRSAEQIWKYAHSKDLGNRTFDDLDQVVEAVADSLHTHPDIVCSMATFDWAKTLLWM
jgi:hypothetical protein